MGYEPLVKHNPLRALKMGTESSKRMGLVMARAGLGKTALLVQIALDSILRGNQVIHVSIGESIEKTTAWYKDIMQSILAESSVTQPHELIDMVQQHRMIMTFQASSFNCAKLEERLNDLVVQNIFKPNCLVIDGFDFAAATRKDLDEIKELTSAMNLQTWFSAVSHREDQRKSAAGVPAPCHELDDLFDTIILLKPEEGKIRLDTLKNKGATLEDTVGLTLNPSTMMIHRD